MGPDGVGASETWMVPSRETFQSEHKTLRECSTSSIVSVQICNRGKRKSSGIPPQNSSMRSCRVWRAATAATAATPAPLRRHCRACSSEPPSPTTFPAWRPLDFFHFEILHQSRRSNARVGRCVDMHMHVHMHMHVNAFL